MQVAYFDHADQLGTSLSIYRIEMKSFSQGIVWRWPLLQDFGLPPPWASAPLASNRAVGRGTIEDSATGQSKTVALG